VAPIQRQSAVTPSSSCWAQVSSWPPPSWSPWAWARLVSRAWRSPFPGLSGGGALSAGAIVLLQTANAMSLITMPLLITRTVRGTTRDVGLIFGLSAALEIPCMLLLGWAAGRFAYLRVMLLSWLFGPLLFASMAAATSIWQIAIAQVLSALYVAGLLGVALAYFQQLLDEPGSATTPYFNGLTAGSTIAGVLWGAAVAAGGYRGAYIACLLRGPRAQDRRHGAADAASNSVATKRRSCTPAA
jgi:MFS family permease